MCFVSFPRQHMQNQGMGETVGLTLDFTNTPALVLRLIPAVA